MTSVERKTEAERSTSPSGPIQYLQDRSKSCCRKKKKLSGNLNDRRFCITCDTVRSHIWRSSSSRKLSFLNMQISIETPGVLCRQHIALGIGSYTTNKLKRMSTSHKLKPMYKLYKLKPMYISYKQTCIHLQPETRGSPFFLLTDQLMRGHVVVPICLKPSPIIHHDN